MNSIMYNTSNREYPYQQKAADILLDRIRTCQSQDAFNFILALKELFNEEPASITLEETISEDIDSPIDSNKRHWAKV